MSPEMHNEINRNPSIPDRKRLHSVVESYPRLGLAPQVIENWEEKLGGTTLPNRIQDISDLRHVSYAAAAGIAIFVTRDGALRDRLADVALALAGLHVVSPSEVESLLDEIDDSAPYRPASLMRTGYTSSQLRVDDEQDVLALLSNASGEKKAKFLQVCRSLGEGGDQSTRLVVRRADSTVAGLVGAIAIGDELQVPLLRTGVDPLAATLAVQLTGELRRQAARLNRNIIRVSDAHIGAEMRSALVRQGFRQVGKDLVGLSVDGLHSSSAVIVSLKRMSVEMQASFNEVIEALGRIEQMAASAEEAAAVERVLGPLILEDSPISTFLIPIKSHFASPLLNYPLDLFGRDDELGMSLEHVYYRSPFPAPEQVPSRLLWYISAGGPSGSAVVATSQLIASEDLSATKAFKLNSRLGVYSYRQVADQADANGKVKAIRFVNTRLLSRPVTLRRLQSLAASHGQGLMYQSPLKLAPSFALDVVREGFLV